MKVTLKETGEDVTREFYEDLKNLVEGKKPVHFPVDPKDNEKVENDA